MQTRPIPPADRFVAALIAILSMAVVGALAIGSTTSVQAASAQEATVQSIESMPHQNSAIDVTTIAFTPIADTHITNGAPDQNYQEEDSLAVSKMNFGASTVEFRSLLQFDLSAIPAGSIIQRAELRLLQTGGSGENVRINVARIEERWKAGSVTWSTKPAAQCCFGTNNIEPLQEVAANWTVVDLVQRWVANPSATPNYGMELSASGSGTRIYNSMEGLKAPELIISFTPPVTEIQIPANSLGIDIDGNCDLQTEYASAASYPFADANGAVGTVYLVHGNKYLNVCVIGARGLLSDRFYTLYLDTDNGREKFAEEDDYGLKLGVLISSFNDSLIGTGQGGYVSGTLPSSWSGSAQEDTINDMNVDVAEYQIPLPLFESYCGAPFGIALYHHWLDRVGDDYGWPTSQFWDQPQTWVQATLAGRSCRRVQVCSENGRVCAPAENASVFRTSDANSTDEYQTDANGIVPAQVNIGDTIWAMVPISNTPTYPISVTNPSTLYYTSGVPVTVQIKDFDPDTGIMRLPVSAQKPLLVQDIDVAAQWNLEGDEQFKRKLEADLRKMSDYFYDFTNGQFALGKINVYQNYSNWFESDVWLHADNNQRPLSVVGGIVDTITVDVALTEPISYTPGHIYIGSEWNRYNEPPNDPDIVTVPTTGTIPLADDWAVALAHELSHYLLFQWDVYYGLVDDPENEGKTKAVPIETCTGSAMGNVYFLDNTEFISDKNHWNANCKNTHAYQEVGDRTEWETIQEWYPWAISPVAVNSGPMAPPVQLTSVTFITSPTAMPTLANQPFNLLYEDGENASDRANAYIIRDDRVIEQGQPAEGSTQIALTGAQEGDRFCLFDIKNIVSQMEDDNATSTDTTTRHQYGCKFLATPPINNIEEYELDMEKDELWEPVIYVTPITSKTMNISVTLPVTAPALNLKVRIYPEHKQGSTEDVLVRNGNVYSNNVTLPEFTPSAYVQVWAEEGISPTETDPRREAMIGYGTKGAVVQGAASWGCHAPIISPKGDFIIVSDRDVNLQKGEFIAIQEAYALPKLPDNTTSLTTIAGYRLIALPQTLVTSGAVSLRYLPPPSTQVQSAHVAQTEPANLQIYFWDGGHWEALDTTTSQEENGHFLASASLRGVGLYALFANQASAQRSSIFLPLIQQQ